MASSALSLQGPLGNVLYTSDVKNLQVANLLRFVHDNTIAIFQDTSFTVNGAHAFIKDILAYYPSDVHTKIYAMHYNDNIEDFLSEMKREGSRYVAFDITMNYIHLRDEHNYTIHIARSRYSNGQHTKSIF